MQKEFPLDASEQRDSSYVFVYWQTDPIKPASKEKSPIESL